MCPQPDARLLLAPPAPTAAMMVPSVHDDGDEPASC